MVIGSGLLAKSFHDYASNEAVIIFASGVSDSKTNDEQAFLREEKLLTEVLKANPHKLLVYFSTCSVLDKSLAGMPYTRHKLLMEIKVMASGANYLIFRVSNLVGYGGNPKTIMNFFVSSMRQGTPIQVWRDAYRNMLDVDDAYQLMDYFIATGHKNTIINIANPVSYNSVDILKAVELYLNLPANYTLLNEGELFFIDTTAVQQVAPQLGLNFNEDYLPNLLQKYYAPS